MHDVKFHLTEEDVRAVGRYQRSHGFGRTYFLLVAIGVPLAVVGALLWSAYEDRSFKYVFKSLPYMILLFAVVFGLLWLVRMSNFTQLRKKGIFDHEMVVGLRVEGLYHKDLTGEATTKWSAISKIVDFRRHIFFVLSFDENVILVPKSSFQDEQSLAEFHQRARELWQAAKANGSQANPA